MVKNKPASIHRANAVKTHFDATAAEYDYWKKKARYYYSFVKNIYKSYIPPGRDVLEIGCGTGEILASVSPGLGVGIDNSLLMIKQARRKFPQYKFLVDDAQAISKIKQQFSYIIMSDLVEHVYDVQTILEQARKLLKPQGQIILTCINPLWSPIFDLAEKLKLKAAEGPHKWVSSLHLKNMLEQAGYRIKESGHTFIIPKKIPLLSDLINRILPKLPVLRQLCIIQYFVAEAAPFPQQVAYSISVVIPCFNEEDNVQDCIRQVPSMGKFTEIIVVDDGSGDQTAIRARALISKYPNLKVISYKPNRGKVWAVKEGLDQAKGDIVMIWDADRTVPAEELPRFYDVIAHGQGSFVNGTRMVYPMERQAMKTLNVLGNTFFGWLYSWILSTTITDTLCGTKALLKKDYLNIKMGTEPWGDFDLLFGAGRLGLTIREAPVHYKMRVAGQSKMRTLRYGMVVAKMSLIGIWRFKIKGFFKKKISAVSRLINNNYLLWLIFLLALVLRIMGVFPNLLGHPDEAHTQNYSRALVANILTKGDFDPHTYKYGSFIFYLQAAVAIPILTVPYFYEQFVDIGKNPISVLVPFSEYISDIGPHIHREAILSAGRGATAVVGALTIFLVYQIAKKLFGKPVGLISALILAVLPFHVRESHYITTDIPALFFILLAVNWMVNLWQTNKLRWYILSGLAIGYSSSVRYFPIALLVLPLACLFVAQKDKAWVLKVMIGLVMVAVGLFLGVPFLPFNDVNRAIFKYEMENIVLPFYSTTISTYFTSWAAYITSAGSLPLPSLDSLLPQKFSPFHAGFLFNHGLTPALTLTSLLGALIGVFSSFKKTIFLLAIPAATFVYASFYLRSIYERTTLPVTAFVAIFAGYYLYFIWQKITQHQLGWPGKIMFLVLAGVILWLPFYSSLSSSWACSQPTIIQEGQTWIDQNISVDDKIAYQQAGISFPVKPFKFLEELHPRKDFSLEEIRAAGNDYAFIHGGALGYYTYPYINDFFITPVELYDNSYIPLVLKEYQTRAALLKKVARPFMCTAAELFFFRLPPPIPQQPNLAKEFNFNNVNDLDFWQIQNFGRITNKIEMIHNLQEGIGKKGVLEYRWSSISYTAPRFVSRPIPVLSGKKYTIEGWIKSSNNLEPDQRDGFLRVDFYKEMNFNSLLPGDVVALTPRIYGPSGWKFVTVSAQAPEKVVYLTISFQISGSQTTGSFFVDDIKIWQEE
ncbi:glycosyltransferase [Candidatus Daviesbacteria bacterium]|nr:glycosyltransferase [Candidatus Daviesbacteria bacterium]